MKFIKLKVRVSCFFFFFLTLIYTTILTSLRLLLSLHSGLASLVRLERLELGFNLIKRVEGLNDLLRIEKLELNNNLLYRMDDIRVLKERYVFYLLGIFADRTHKGIYTCSKKSYRLFFFFSFFFFFK